MDEKMYDSLRTQQQLGYYVGCAKKKTCGIYGISFVLQSAELPPPVLEQKIIEFTENFYHEHLNEEEPEKFEKYKKGIINRLKSGF